LRHEASLTGRLGVVKDSTTDCRRLIAPWPRDDRQMIAAFSIAPVGAGDSVSETVAECIAIVRASGIPNETNAMFTNLEGDWDEVMDVIKQCLDHVAAVAPRVSLVIKIDHRPGVSDALHGKVAAIEAHLGHQ
jgi:uncharacterized protein (TIGR00106 family)